MTDNAAFTLHKMTEEERRLENERINEMARRDEATMKDSARCVGMEQGRAEGRIKGKFEAKINAIKALMDNMKIGAEQAMDMLGIAKEDRGKYLPLLG